MHARWFISLILVLGTTLPAVAWGSTQTETLSWEGCVQVARQQNPTLRSAWQQTQAKEALYLSGFNALLPSLDLGYGQTLGSQRPDAWQPIFEGSVQWDLFNWKDYAGVQLAMASLNQARSSWLMASAQVRYQLTRAFYQLLYAQAQVAVLEDIRRIRQTNSQLVTLSYDSGKESKGNMLITQADLAAAVADVAQAQRTTRVAQQALNHAMGREGNLPVLVQGDFNLPVAPAWEEIEVRLPRLPQVQRDEALIEESKAMAQQAWSQVLPNLEANYRRTWAGQPLGANGPEWNAAISLNFPIFAGGPTASFLSIAAVQDQVIQAEADKQADLQQLQGAAESAWSDLLAGIDQVSVQQQYLAAARQRNDEATIEYSNGLMNFENWNQVVTLLVNYEKAYLSARLNANLTRADWENALQTTLEAK